MITHTSKIRALNAYLKKIALKENPDMPQRDSYMIREIGGAGCLFSVVLNGQCADEYIVATEDETATLHGLPDRDLTDDDVFEFGGEKYVIIFNPDDSGQCG